jgi:hypothetical protein
MKPFYVAFPGFERRFLPNPKTHDDASGKEGKYIEFKDCQIGTIRQMTIMTASSC